MAGTERSPVLGNTLPITLGKPDVDTLPLPPVQIGHGGFNNHEVARTLRALHLREQRMHVVKRGCSWCQFHRKLRLRLDLLSDELPCDGQTRLIGGGKCLGTPEPGVVQSPSGGCHQEGAIGVDVGECNANVMEPPNCLQADHAGLSEHHHTPNVAVHARETDPAPTGRSPRR